MLARPTIGNIEPMVLGKIRKVCGEEWDKAARAIVAVWDLMGEADERALDALFFLLRIR